MAERTPLTPGRAFAARYKKQEYRAEVGEDNLVHVYDPKGEEIGSYRSLSKAGSAVMDGIACNGWRFWKDAPAEGTEAEAAADSATETAEPAKPKRAPKKGKKAKATKKPKGRKKAAAS